MCFAVGFHISRQRPKKWDWKLETNIWWLLATSWLHLLGCQHGLLQVLSCLSDDSGVRNHVGKGENHSSERVVIIGHCFKRENNYLSIPIHCPWPLAASALVLWFNQANWANRRVKGQCWWMMSKNSLDFIQLLFWLFLFESSIIFLSSSHHIGQVHSFFQTSQHLSLQLWLVQGLQLLPYRKCIINSVVKHLDGKTCFDMGDLKMTPFIVKWNPNILRHIRLLNKNMLRTRVVFSTDSPHCLFDTKESC